MTKIKKILLSLFVAMVMLLSAFALMGFTTNVSAYADSKTYFSNEKYTESDRLLNSDGSTSVKTIGTFSNEVKSASVGTAFPELAQVIPLKFLESTEQNDTLQYNGKEYGFFVNLRKMQARQFLPSGLGQTFPPYNSVSSEIDLAIYPRRCNT